MFGMLTNSSILCKTREIFTSKIPLKSGILHFIHVKCIFDIYISKLFT